MFGRQPPRAQRIPAPPGTELREFRFIFHSDPRNLGLEKDQLRALAEGFVRANEMAIAANPGAYPQTIEQAALRYVKPVRCNDPHPCQRVLGVGPLFELGEETCLGLAALHCALLRYFDNDAGARVAIEPQSRFSRGAWHALVVTGAGRVLDTQSIVEQQFGMVAGRRPIR